MSSAQATPAITANSRWWGEHIQCEVTVTRVTDREVTYAAVDHPFAGTLPQWKFLDSFQPCKRKPYHSSVCFLGIPDVQ